MSYEKITLNYNGEEKDYDLIEELYLEKYNANYILFTEDAQKEEMNVYCMKVLDDGNLVNPSFEEEKDCKEHFLGGDANV